MHTFTECLLGTDTRNSLVERKGPVFVRTAVCIGSNYFISSLGHIKRLVRNDSSIRRAVGPNRGDIFPPGDIWQCLQTLLTEVGVDGLVVELLASSGQKSEM